MKNINRFLSIAAITLFLLVFLSAAGVNAAGKVKLNKRNIRVKQGKSITLQLKGMENGSVGNGATDGAELDIIELVPYENMYYMSVHWDGYEKGELQTHCEPHEVDDSFYDTYHDIWYVWDEEGYRMYMDGTDDSALIFNFPSDKYGDGSCAVPCDIVISSEFGKWGGGIDEAQLPAHFYVDYVKAYQLKK